MDNCLSQSFVEPFHIITVIDGFDHMQESRMRTRQSLSELDQITGENVGAFYGDSDRDSAVSVGEEVGRSVADA